MVSYDTDWAPWANFGPLRRFGEGTRRWGKEQTRIKEKKVLSLKVSLDRSG